MLRRRWAAAVAGALLLVLAACGEEGGPSQAAVRDSAGQAGIPRETTTSSSSGTPPTTTARGGQTTTTAAGRPSTPTTARAGGSTATTAPTGPRALSPPAPGTYRYDTSGTTTFGGTSIPFPAVTTLVLDPPSGSRQRATRNLRDPAGNGLSTEFLLDYRPEGVFLVSLRLTVGVSGVSDTRELRPASPVVLLATGARPGARLEADLAGGTTAARLVADVLGEERVTVGGQAVDTLAVRAVVTLAPGDVTGRQELTVNVDRGSRLWVRERSVTDASAGGGLFTLHSEYTATLQRLTP
ncbi:MAG TPA: hypothetical protein VHF91_07805 [Acidimicrobiales bacterium]|nr:hypothetical protein [Acidimicrobiales bacterium]